MEWTTYEVMLERNSSQSSTESKWDFQTVGFPIKEGRRKARPGGALQVGPGPSYEGAPLCGASYYTAHY